jgi:hypothetical protein
MRVRDFNLWKMCWSKKKYGVKTRAKSDAKELGCEVYECPICKYWHVGHNRRKS